MVLIVHLNNIIIHSSETYYYAYSPTTTPTYSVPTGYGQRVGVRGQAGGAGRKRKRKRPTTTTNKKQRTSKVYIVFWFLLLCLMSESKSFFLVVYFLFRKETRLINQSIVEVFPEPICKFF